MSRVRDRSRVVDYQGINWYDYGGGPISSTYTLSCGQLDKMTDEPTKNFKKLSAEGVVIITPMSKIVETMTPLPSTGLITSGLGKTGWSGFWGAEQGEYPGSTLELPNLVEAISKAKTLSVTASFAGVGSPDVALLTELVEIRETLAFLYSPVKGMVNLTRRFRSHLKRVNRLEASYAKRMAKWNSLPPRVQAKRVKPPDLKLPSFKVGKFEGSDVSSAWLAYRYGLMPLIYTFQDIQALLKKRLESANLRVTSRGKHVESVDLSSISEPSPAWWGGTSFNKTLLRSGTATVTARGGVLYECLPGLADQLGLQWNRVPAALYEGIPLSFVADWFQNGSEVYDALTAEFRANKILGSWSVVTVDYNCTYTARYGPALTPGETAFGDCSVSFKGKSVSRVPTDLTHIGFRFRVELNAKRVADGLALIHTFLATARRR